MIWNSTWVRSMAGRTCTGTRLFSSSTKGPLISWSGSADLPSAEAERRTRRTSASTRAISSDTEKGLVI